MKALDIATYLLKRHGPMEAMKLQKLVYYSQAWFLVERGVPLFDDEIQAWAYGPVIYDLYRAHRGSLVVQAVQSGDAAAVEASGDAVRVVSAVWQKYGAMSSAELSRLTHAEAPWRDARQEPAGEIGQTPISTQAMREFYIQQPPLNGLSPN